MPPLIRTILSSFAFILGVLAFSGGAYSFYDPIAWSASLGIQIQSLSSPTIPFAQLVGARNIASGLTIFVLLYTRQRRALGLTLMVGTVVSLVDAWIIANNGGLEGKAMGHAGLGLAIWAMGAVFYWG